VSEALIRVTRGSSATKTMAARTASGDLVASFTGSETITATVWRGDDTAPLFSVTGTWATPPSFTVAFSAGQTDLEPGRYPINLTIGTVTKPAGYLEILPAPGVAESPRSYLTASEGRELLRGLGDLLQTRTDQTGLLNLFGRASEELDDAIADAYSARFAQCGPAMVRAARADMLTALAADGLTVNSAVRRFVAYRGASLLLATMPAPPESGIGSARRAARDEADAAMRRLVAEVAGPNGQVVTVRFSGPMRIER
jgi:hypothetical protein